MNKIVSEHVKATDVPMRFRRGINEAAVVTVTVEEEASRSPTRTELANLLKQARSLARGITTEEAVARVRSLRDEWDT